MHLKMFLFTPFSESQKLNKQETNTMNWNWDKNCFICCNAAYEWFNVGYSEVFI